MPRIKRSKTGVGTNEETIGNSDIQDDFQHDASLVANEAEGTVATEEAIMISCVKMKLKTFCKDAHLIAVLNNVVMDCNHIMLEAYCFANMHVLRLLESGRELPVIDRNFYYRCIMAIGTSAVRVGTLGSDLIETQRIFDSQRVEGVSKINLIGYNQVIADLSIVMATMATNHLWTNLEARINKYVKVFHKSIKPKYRKQITTALVLAPKAPIESIVTNPAAVNVARELKAIMNLPSALQTKKYSNLTIPLYFHILKSFESFSEKVQGKTKPPKCFSILPLKSNFTISHVPISAMMLLSILKKKLGHSEIEGIGQKADPRKYWDKYFNLNGIETQNRRFGNRIITDGYAVSVPLTRSTTTCCQKNIQDSNELFKLIRSGEIKDTVGVDPGISDVVNVAHFASLGSFLEKNSIDDLHPTMIARKDTVASYSSGMYYEKSKINTSRRKTSEWNFETKELTENSPKSTTSSFERFKLYIRHILEHKTQLLTHRLKYRAPRFLRHMYRDKIIDEICDMIAPKDTKIIVGFGNWKLSNKSPISRKTCGPIEDIKKRLRNRENVWLMDIDEYCTSKKCCCCHQTLTNSKASSTRIRKDGSKNITFGKVHKMLHCKPTHAEKKAVSSLRCSKTWNRDVNASKNILLLTIFEICGKMRPKAFSRSKIRIALP